MSAKPVHDLRLLDCQQRIDRLLEGSEDLPQEQVHELFGALYRSMQDAWAAVLPVSLPRTDEVVHQAWDTYLAGGLRGQYWSLVVAATVKIATEAGVGSADGGETGVTEQLKARSNWGPPRPQLLLAHIEFQLLANRFGGHCGHDGCEAWVPAGHGAVLNDASGMGTHCLRHADQATVRAHSQERSGPITCTDPRIRFLDARLREEEQQIEAAGDELRWRRIEAQRLIMDACADTDLRTNEGKALRYALRCLLLPYASHLDFRMTWLPRRDGNPAPPIAENTIGGTSGDLVSRD
ncbi:hypothetical protein [Streptomyces sp. SID12501]|nr:hypothetical protein [Streptomyces sp. SID12501]